MIQKYSLMHFTCTSLCPRDCTNEWSYYNLPSETWIIDPTLQLTCGKSRLSNQHRKGIPAISLSCKNLYYFIVYFPNCRMVNLGRETCCDYVRISPTSQLAPSLNLSVDGIGVYKYLEDNSNSKSTERVYYNSAAGLFLHKNRDLGYWEVSYRIIVCLQRKPLTLLHMMFYIFINVLQL